jgi:hypothetical protein
VRVVRRTYLLLLPSSATEAATVAWARLIGYGELNEPSGRIGLGEVLSGGGAGRHDGSPATSNRQHRAEHSETCPDGY